MAYLMKAFGIISAGWLGLCLNSIVLAAGPEALKAVQPGVPDELKGIGITEKLGETVPIGELTFRDENGKEVKLSQYFKSKKPVLLNLVYYECPSLCSWVLNGLLNSLKEFEWTPGKEFELVTLSIDPKETHEIASQKKKNYIQDYGRPEAAEGWHFLTGDEDQIKRLADAVGFGYRYQESDGQYAHSAALFALTPEGSISRILYGIEYPVRDMRLALLEASDGKIGTVIDRILLLCFRYDPITRRYSLLVSRVMQAGGASTVLVFGGYLAVFWRRQRKLGERDGDAENPEA